MVFNTHDLVLSFKSMNMTLKLDLIDSLGICKIEMFEIYILTINDLHRV